MVEDWREKDSKSANFTYSGGFTAGNDGKIGSVLWDSAAFKAGLVPGDQILALNGRAYDPGRDETGDQGGGRPGPCSQLMVKAGDVYKTISLDWHGGLRIRDLRRPAKGQERSTPCWRRAEASNRERHA